MAYFSNERQSSAALILALIILLQLVGLAVGQEPAPAPPGGLTTAVSGGACGSSAGAKCPASECCSQFDFCGTDAAHCGTGCQLAYGTCTSGTPAPSPSSLPTAAIGGACRPGVAECPAPECCSSSSFCGVTADHCTVGCQVGYGNCTLPGAPAPSPTASSLPTAEQGGKCGSGVATCPPSQCCSTGNYCGLLPDHCSIGLCQPAYGVCSDTYAPPPPPPAGTTPPSGSLPIAQSGGKCGAGVATCPGSQCCSNDGYCGEDSKHCAPGNCWSGYGYCDPAPSPPPGTPSSTPPLPSGGSPSPSKSSSSSSVVGLAVGIPAALALLGALAVLACCCLRSKQRKGPAKSESQNELESRLHDSYPAGGSEPDLEKGAIKIYPAVTPFSLQAIYAMTDNLSKTNVLGEGGYGVVYKAHDSDGRQLAVKVAKEANAKNLEEFKREVAIMSKLSHRNLLSLVGYCATQEAHILVYPFAPNGSLKDRLRKQGAQGAPLTLLERVGIAVGVAEGLSYLHKDAGTDMVHRDVKPDNILLTKDLQPKIADFGLMKLVEETQEQTRVAGTPGYVDPEYVKTGKLSQKIDIFSFGVVLLELLTGKGSLVESGEPSDVEPSDVQSHSVETLADWATAKAEEGGRHSILDKSLGASLPPSAAEALVVLALKCVERDGRKRPPIDDVVRALKNVQSSLTASQPYSVRGPAAGDGGSGSGSGSGSSDGFGLSAITSGSGDQGARGAADSRSCPDGHMARAYSGSRDYSYMEAR